MSIILFFLAYIWKKIKKVVFYIFFCSVFPPTFHQRHPWTSKKHLVAPYLLATQNSIVDGQLYLKNIRKEQSRRHVFCLVVNNSGMLAVGLFFSIIKGWTFFCCFLPHHRLSIEVWAVLHGACHSEFFHPDRNRWGRPVAHCMWSRQSRTDASILRGLHGRQTLQPPLHSSAIHTKNKDWKLKWPLVYITGFLVFPTFK